MPIFDPENQIECIWKYLSKDPNSTTFQDANEKLERCKICVPSYYHMCGYYRRVPKDIDKCGWKK